MENVLHAVAVLLPLPFSTRLHLDGPPTCHHRARPRPLRRRDIKCSGRTGERKGTGAEWGSGKMSSPSSSILQCYLVKANTGRYLPWCHWKGGSDASAWHANIVACTNDDALLASLFMASSNRWGGGKSVESNWRSRVQLSTSRSCSGSDRNLNVSSCYVLALRRESRWCTGAILTHTRKSRWWLKRRHTISCWWTAASKLW